VPKPGISIDGFDHIALTFRDLPAAVHFYDQVFGIEIIGGYVVGGRLLVQQVLIGRAMISMHQLGNGVEPVAANPAPACGDICFRWGAPIEQALAVLADRGVLVVEGPVPRTDCNGRPAISVYFQDPEGNLVELMAPAIQADREEGGS
jgi:catechol 2,3-dioxygenase-like lactoylglutathione lyase family enzyme